MASLKTDRKVRLPPVVTAFSGVTALTMTIRRCAKDSIRKRFATYTQEPWAPNWTGQATACRTLYDLETFKNITVRRENVLWDKTNLHWKLDIIVDIVISDQNYSPLSKNSNNIMQKIVKIVE